MFHVPTLINLSFNIRFILHNFARCTAKFYNCCRLENELVKSCDFHFTLTSNFSRENFNIVTLYL